MNVLAFDIETVPDIDGGRRLYGVDDLDPSEVAEVMFTKRREKTDSEFLPVHLHCVVTISAVLRSGEVFKVWSLGREDSGEAEIISRFFDGIARYTPTLVTWNGSGFDLPVLHYRSLLHGIAAPRYWDVGDDDKAFRWNNYLNRFHYRHTDLMDVLAGHQARCAASLDEVAVLCGLPGKMGMDGSKVWDAYQQGQLGAIRNYCETDALNTYLLYLRWERIRGNLSCEQWQRENDIARQALQEAEQPHLSEFLDAWQ